MNLEKLKKMIKKAIEKERKGAKVKNKTTLKGSLLLSLVALIAIVGAVIWGVWALFHFSWQASEEVVSGIVYDAHFDDWPAHNTTFKIRAAAEMAVTEGTSPTYCLPSGSQYESVVREAAENKDIKVIVKVKQMPPHFREGVFKCEDNVEVAKKEEK